MGEILRAKQKTGSKDSLCQNFALKTVKSCLLARKVTSDQIITVNIELLLSNRYYTKTHMYYFNLILTLKHIT